MRNFYFNRLNCGLWAYAEGLGMEFLVVDDQGNMIVLSHSEWESVVYYLWSGCVQGEVAA